MSQIIRMIYAFCTGLFIFTACYVPNDEDKSKEYRFTYKEKVYISSLFCGKTTKIAGNIFTPVAKYEGELFPAIIFINSWAFEEHEYIVQAMKFAKKGYVVLSYSSRGWWASEGFVKMGNNEDWADFSSVLDWLLQNAPVDENNIGVCGISLGGGGALNAISHDSRVKTAAALSSYMDQFRSMYSEDTPRLIWGSLLALAGTLTGRIDPEIYKVLYCTLSNTDIEWVMQWTALRSPINYIDAINCENKPIYLSHNFGDYMFQPDVAIDYFNTLTVSHKRLDLNQGTHMSAEGVSLLFVPSYAMDNVHKWFDYWLKGIDTGIIPDKEQSAIISMEELGTKERHVFSTQELEKKIDNETVYKWPANSIEYTSFYCAPRGILSNGKLNVRPMNYSQTNTINSGILSGATAGAVLFPLLEQFNITLKTNLAFICRNSAITYESDSFPETKRIRGSADMTLRISLSKQSGQVFVYLYDVDAWGNATFITHGFKTFWHAVPNAVMNVKIPLLAQAYDIPAGNHLAVVIDTTDIAYGKPSLNPFSIKFFYNTEENFGSVIRVPFLE